MASATALKAIRGQIQNIHFMYQLIMHSLSYLISLHFEYDSKKNTKNIENCFVYRHFYQLYLILPKSMRLFESNLVAFDNVVSKESKTMPVRKF